MKESGTPEIVQASRKPPRMEVCAWGVRGSLPTPAPEVMGFGGNTPCLELKFGDEDGCSERIILDAGTGIRFLGRHLVKSKCLDVVFHVFLTHFHWDHVQGLPFFPALYNKAATVTFYSSRTPQDLKQILLGQMEAPYFPVRFVEIPASLHFVQVTETPLVLGEVAVSSFCLTHPQGSSGFRVSYRGKTLVYATDHEHGQEEADRRLLQAACGADLLFYDAQYTPEEHAKRIGWGHSTWVQATEVAAAAHVKQLVLFHHDPTHDDAKLEAILSEARLKFPRTIAAREGETLILS